MKRDQTVYRSVVIQELKDYGHNVARKELLKAKIAECRGGEKTPPRAISASVLHDIQREYEFLTRKLEFLQDALYTLSPEEQIVIQCLALSKMPWEAVEAELGLTHKQLATIRARAIKRLVGIYSRAYEENGSVA